MRVGIGNTTWVSAAAIALLVGSATVASAELPGHFQQAGRIHGFGWGDGYHTCERSNPRWRDDLPPRPQSSVVGHRCRPDGPVRALKSRRGSTFYDRFDAANRGRKDCSRCDQGGCDTCQGNRLEHSSGATVEPLPQPSSMSQPAVSHPSATSSPSSSPSAAAADAIEVVPAAPKPKVAPPIAPAQPAVPAAPESPLSEIQSDPAGLPAPQVEAVVRRPIRPEPPAYVAPRLITVPVLVENPEKSAPIADAAPRTKAPTPPVVNRPATPSGSAAAPGPFGQRLAIDPLPSIPPSPRSAPELPVASPIGGVSESIPSYARVSPPSIDRPATVAATPTGSAYDMPVRPARLGTNTPADSSSDLVMPFSTPLRPARLGSQSNPDAARPVVEMATRPDESSDAVIRQPSAGSLR